jgi:hypothetical protein
MSLEQPTFSAVSRGVGRVEAFLTTPPGRILPALADALRLRRLAVCAPPRWAQKACRIDLAVDHIAPPTCTSFNQVIAAYAERHGNSRYANAATTQPRRVVVTLEVKNGSNDPHQPRMQCAFTMPAYALYDVLWFA